ncbi:MAG: hypothetical protein ACSW8G_02405 [Bacillota bacterium]
MAYVSGPLGKQIEELMNTANEKNMNGEFQDSIQLLEEAWDLLPGEKNEYDESFLIVWAILPFVWQKKFSKEKREN